MTTGFDDESVGRELDMIDQMNGIVPPATRGEWNSVPDGDYTARVTALKFERAGANKDGKLLLKWQLKVVGGEFDGSPLSRNNGTETFQNLEWLKADLVAAGLDASTMSMRVVADHLHQLVGARLSVAVKRNMGRDDKEYVNVYINGRAAGSDVPDIIDPFADQEAAAKGEDW